MKRTAGVVVLLAMSAGGVWQNPGARAGEFMSSYWGGPHCGTTCGASVPPSVPNVQGPWGQPVPMAAPYTSQPPSGAAAAQAMLNSSIPLNMIQQAGYGGSPSGVAPAQYCPPGGCPPGALPPPGGLSPPGVGAMPPVPGMTPPPPGPPLTMGGPRAPGAVAAVGALTGPSPNPFPAQRTQVFFTGPPGMRISWFAPGANGQPGFTPEYIEAPGRYNFLQAAIYRLRLTDIPGRGTVELYPTLEVVPANPKTSAFLAHSAVPVSFTDEDLEQVASGNFVVKVIYLPDPQFQDLATTGPSEIISSRLEAGVDPIAEACRRGSILLVVRLSNIDLNLAHSPAMDAPSPYQPHGAAPAAPGMLPPGMAGPGMMPGMAGPGMAGPPGANGLMVPGAPGGPMIAPTAPIVPPAGNTTGSATPPGPPSPTGAVSPAPVPPGGSSPVGQLPSPVQSADYKNAPAAPATPASLASQPPPGTTTTKKPAARSWLLP